MKFVALFSILAIMLSCSSEMSYPDAPDDLISEEQMVIYLHDLTLLEAGIQNRYQSVNRYYKSMIKSGDKYFKSKGISADRFERSYEYYASQPEVFQRISTKAMEEMTIELNELNSK